MVALRVVVGGHCHEHTGERLHCEHRQHRCAGRFGMRLFCVCVCCVHTSLACMHAPVCVCSCLCARARVCLCAYLFVCVRLLMCLRMCICMCSFIIFLTIATFSIINSIYLFLLTGCSESDDLVGHHTRSERMGSYDSLLPRR